MINRLNFRFAAILLLSILIYGFPFHLGGFGLRLFFAIVILIILIDLIRIIWKQEDKSARNSLLMGLLNSFVLFHLALIYSYLMFEATTTLIVGVVLGGILYLLITNRMKQVF